MEHDKNGDDDVGFLVMNAGLLGHFEVTGVHTSAFVKMLCIDEARRRWNVALVENFIMLAVSLLEYAICAQMD